MRAQLALCVATVIGFGGGSILLAEEKGAREGLVPKIFAEWQAKRERIRTIICEAKVQSFYPKGYLSSLWLPQQTAEFEPVLPSEDKQFADEPYSLAVDFAAKRVRKEFRITGIYADTTQRFLALEYGLHLFNNGQYKVFRPKETYPEEVTRSASLPPDVLLFENASHQFLFSFSDLPLLWLAGGVSGRYPLPEAMLFLANAADFKTRGEAQREGKDCVVLTAQEQQSKDALREFWVGVEPPYPIYYCRSRNGERIDWQLEVKYRLQGHDLVPSEWVYTGYLFPGKSFRRQTYSVQRIELNSELPAELFDRKPEPGQTVYKIPNHTMYEVNKDGGLIPVGEARPQKKHLVSWNMLAFIILASVAALLVAWRYLRKRSPGS
jgi:hypothetical protein